MFYIIDDNNIVISQSDSKIKMKGYKTIEIKHETNKNYILYKLVNNEFIKTNAIIEKENKEKVLSFKKEFENEIESILEKYTSSERLTFDIQYKEAIGKEKIYLLEKLADIKGMKIEDYKKLVIKKREYFLENFYKSKKKYTKKVNNLLNKK